MNIFFNIKIILYILYKLKEEKLLLIKKNLKLKHINNKIKKKLLNNIQLVSLTLENTNLLYKNKLYY